MTEFSVTSERIDKYLGLTAKALEKVSIIDKPGSDNHAKAEDILGMVNAYYSDAQYFYLKVVEMMPLQLSIMHMDG